MTKSGKKCLEWYRVPSYLQKLDDSQPEFYFSNFCRNPITKTGKAKDYIWCFTDIDGTQEDCELQPQMFCP